MRTTRSDLPMPQPLAALRDDTRGAVMMTGVFLAAVLIGALWFVIGIGDAIIFRDRMQEAADQPPHAVPSDKMQAASAKSWMIPSTMCTTTKRTMMMFTAEMKFIPFA